MRMHIALYRLTRGALGSRFGKRNFMLLTTTGRKSGQERVTPIFYIPEEGHFLLIASNWGAATDPQWWQNLQKNPLAKAQIGGKTVAITARQADAEERASLWSLITASYANFADYQRHTTREIPVVFLTPTS